MMRTAGNSTAQMSQALIVGFDSRLRNSGGGGKSSSSVGLLVVCFVSAGSLVGDIS